MQRMREKGLKGTGRGKGAKSDSSAGRDSHASRSRSNYSQRNDDWSNYDRREMRSSGSSGSNQPFNAFGNSRQSNSNSNSAGSNTWSNN